MKYTYRRLVCFFIVFVTVIMQAEANASTAQEDYRAGSKLFVSSKDKDMTKVIQLWEQAAKKGHGVAAYNLGQIFEHGEGMPRSLDKARFFYALAKKQGIKVPILKVTEKQKKLVKASHSKVKLSDVVKNENKTQLEKKQHEPKLEPVACSGVYKNIKKGNTWLKQQEVTHYSLQLMVVSDCNNLKTLIAKNSVLDLAIYAKKINKNKTLYGLMTGNFSTRAEAEAFAKTHQLQGVWPRLFGPLQKLL